MTFAYPEDLRSILDIHFVVITIFQFNVHGTMRVESTTHLHVDNLRVLRTASGIATTSRSGHLQRRFRMSRTHPSILGTVLRVAERCIGQRWVQTVQMPMKTTIVASDDFTFSPRRKSTTEAQDDPTFAIKKL